MNSKRFPKPQPKLPKPKPSVKDWLQAHKTDLQKAGSLFLLFLGIVSLLAVSPGLRLKRFVENIQEGDYAPRGITADFDFSYVDQEATAQKRELARTDAPPVYFFDQPGANEILNELEVNLFGDVGTALREGKSWEEASSNLERYKIDEPIFILLKKTEPISPPEEEGAPPIEDGTVTQIRYVNLPDITQKTSDLLKEVLYGGVIGSETKAAIQQQQVWIRRSNEEEPSPVAKGMLIDEGLALNTLKDLAGTKYYPDDPLKAGAIVTLAQGFIRPTLVIDKADAGAGGTECQGRYQTDSPESNSC